MLNKSKRLRGKSRTMNHIYSNNDYAFLNNIPLFVLELNEKSEKASTSAHNAPDKPKYHNPKPGATKDLTIGSLVEVSNDVAEEPLYGVVKWMGVENGTNFVLVGVELEEEHGELPLTLTDGTHNGERFFKCAENRALFVPLDQCHQDSRFQDGIPTPVHQAAEPNFQSVSEGPGVDFSPQTPTKRKNFGHFLREQSTLDFEIFAQRFDV
jgi:hypothetical protein